MDNQTVEIDQELAVYCSAQAAAYKANARRLDANWAEDVTSQIIFKEFCALLPHVFLAQKAANATGLLAVQGWPNAAAKAQ